MTQPIITRAMSADDIIEIVTEHLADATLPEGGWLDVDVVCDADDEADRVIVSVRAPLGATWGEEVDDTIDLAPLGAAFADSGGGAGGSSPRRGTYVGTYSAWAVK